jgi:hypothetical protein
MLETVPIPSDYAFWFETSFSTALFKVGATAGLKTCVARLRFPLVSTAVINLVVS